MCVCVRVCVCVCVWGQRLSKLFSSTFRALTLFSFQRIIFHFLPGDISLLFDTNRHASHSLFQKINKKLINQKSFYCQSNQVCTFCCKNWLVVISDCFSCFCQNSKNWLHTHTQISKWNNKVVCQMKRGKCFLPFVVVVVVLFAFLLLSKKKTTKS